MHCPGLRQAVLPSVGYKQANQIRHESIALNMNDKIKT